MAKADWAYMVGLLGLILGLAPLLPGWPVAASLIVALVGSALAIGTFTYETRAISKRFSQRILSEITPLFPQSPRDTILNEESDSRGTTFSNNELDTLLTSEAPHIRVRGLDDRYRLPSDLRDLAPYILTKTTKSRWPFNGSGLRLITDLDPATPDRPLVLQPVSYFDFLCSNELMKWRITHEDSVDTPAYRHVIDEVGNLVRLGESRLANIVGISTIAISSDQMLLTVLQTHGNSASAGLMAPSGSGSLEVCDLNEARDLEALVTAGAVREMVEETGMPRDLIGKTRLTGYARWLERGAKPEFYAVTELTATAEEIRSRLTRISYGERIYTGGTKWVPFRDALAAVQPDEGIDLTRQQVEFKQSASLPLIRCVQRYARRSGESADHMFALDSTTSAQATDYASPPPRTGDGGIAGDTTE